MRRRRRVGFLTRLKIRKGLREYHTKRAAGRVLKKPVLFNKDV